MTSRCVRSTRESSSRRLLELRAKLQAAMQADTQFGETSPAATDATELQAAASTAPSAPGTPTVTAISEARTPAAALSDEERAHCIGELEHVQQELARIQGESPLMLPSVNHQAVAEVVADWTGIPVGRMVRDEVSAVLSLADTLGQRVVGHRRCCTRGMGQDEWERHHRVNTSVLGRLYALNFNRIFGR